MKNLVKVLEKVSGVSYVSCNEDIHFTFENRRCTISPTLISNAIQTLGLEGATEELREMFTACITKAPGEGDVVFRE